MGAFLNVSNQYLLERDRHLPSFITCRNFGTTDSLHLATQASEMRDLLPAVGNPSRVSESPQIPSRG